MYCWSLAGVEVQLSWFNLALLYLKVIYSANCVLSWRKQQWFLLQDISTGHRDHDARSCCSFTHNLLPRWGSRGLGSPGAADSCSPVFHWERICLTGVSPVIVMLTCGAARTLRRYLNHVFSWYYPPLSLFALFSVPVDFLGQFPPVAMKLGLNPCRKGQNLAFSIYIYIYKVGVTQLPFLQTLLGHKTFQLTGSVKLQSNVELH